MVKHLVSITLIGAAAAVSACFGDGPMPSAPSGATVLFSAPPSQNCSPGSYIGPISLGPDKGYTSILQYNPVGGDGCNGGGGGPITAAQDVFAFDLAHASVTQVGSAGASNSGAHVEVAAVGSGVAFAYNDTNAGSASTQVIVDPGHLTYGHNQGTEVPLGIVALGSDVYLATMSNANTTGGTDLENPTFPNGGNGGFNNGSGSIWKVGGSQIASWSPQCGGLDRCLVGGGNQLAFVERPSTGGEWQISRLDLGSGAPVPTPVSTTGTGGDFPYGLDADDHLIAWSTTQSCVFNMTGGNQHCEVTDCSISVYDTTAMSAAKNLLSTTRFGCLDAKLSDGYVYFTIVGIYSDNNSMFGRGIGRISIADRTLETLDLGIRGPQAGPRRIFPVGDQLYVVDPFVMARIPKSALDGKHDFTP